MLSWRIGDVTIIRVVELETTMPYRAENPFIPPATPEAIQDIPWLLPNYSTPEGALRMSVHALLIDAPGMKLVIDPCIGNGKSRSFLKGRALNTPFLDFFAETGWKREDVDAVICTHLHVDHVGWNTMLEGGNWVPTFPKARYLFGREEYDHWTSGAEKDISDQAEVMADSVQPIVDAGLVELVEVDQRISDEIRLVPTIGHTPGHVSIVIESRGETAMITGDVMHHPCQIARPDWATQVDSDIAMATETRKTMLAACADKNVLLLGTHFAVPCGGYIRRNGSSYRMDSDFSAA